MNNEKIIEQYPKRLYHYYIGRFVGGTEDTSYRRLGPYIHESKAKRIAARLTTALRTRRALQLGEDYRPIKIQYAGPDTDPKDAK